MRGTTLGWMLGLGLAVGGTLYAASPALADRDRHDDRRDRRDYRDRDRGHDHRRKHNHDDDKVKFKIGIGSRPGPVYVAPTPARRWVAGHYVTREERVLVQAGHYEDRYVPAVYETRYDHCGEPYRVMVRPARYEQVWCPPRYETRVVKEWVPGCWVDGPVVIQPAPRHDRPSWFFGVSGTFKD